MPHWLQVDKQASYNYLSCKNAYWNLYSKASTRARKLHYQAPQDPSNIHAYADSDR